MVLHALYAVDFGTKRDVNFMIFTTGCWLLCIAESIQVNTQSALLKALLDTGARSVHWASGSLRRAIRARQSFKSASKADVQHRQSDMDFQAQRPGGILRSHKQ
jgi:hypothetical protein